jgi:hypothetical protein
VTRNNNFEKSPEQEVLEDLQELEFLAAQIPQDEEEIGYELMMAELVDRIRDVCPKVRQASALRKLVAQFGDAYFFYNQTGDFCLMTDFLLESNEVEKQF